MKNSAIVSSIAVLASFGIQSDLKVGSRFGTSTTRGDDFAANTSDD